MRRGVPLVAAAPKGLQEVTPGSFQESLKAYEKPVAETREYREVPPGHRVPVVKLEKLMGTILLPLKKWVAEEWRWCLLCSVPVGSA